MDAEKMIALEQIITSFAVGQFTSNGVTPTLARVIMRNVYSQFADDCLKETIMKRVEMRTDTEK